MSLFEKTTAELREEILRLDEITLEVPSDENIAGATVEYGETWRPRASIVVKMTPMSYRLTREGEPVTTNLQETSRVPVTYSSVDKGLTLAEVAAIREVGWPAIPAAKLVKLPRNLKARQADKLFMPYQRWARKATDADLHIDINELNGQPYSDDYGKLFVVESGTDSFFDGNSNPWMMYIVRRAPEDYVALPLEEREVRIIPQRGERGGGQAAASAVATPVGITGEQLAAALQAAGFDGVKASDFATPKAQSDFIVRSLRVAPILASREVSSQAQQGTLLDYLADKGAIDVGDDGVVRLVG